MAMLDCLFDLILELSYTLYTISDSWKRDLFIFSSPYKSILGLFSFDVLVLFLFLITFPITSILSIKFLSNHSSLNALFYGFNSFKL